MQDSLRIEIRDLKEQLCDISPKVESYQKIATRVKELEARLISGNSAPLRKLGRSKDAKFNRTIFRNR